MDHLSVIDLLDLLATFILANVAAETIKYFVTKIWLKLDSQNVISYLDVLDIKEETDNA